jgi:hypothetical protein
MYGTIAKVAVPGDTGSFLLILGTLTRVSIVLTVAAVMSSVSEFIGFIVISIFPSQSQKKVQIRQPFYRHKTGDPLISNDEDSRDDVVSDEETLSLPGSSRAATPLTGHHTKTAEPTKYAALSKPDFWMIAIIMAMRTTSFRPLLKM